jgi:hypothetical protein
MLNRLISGLVGWKWGWLLGLLLAAPLLMAAGPARPAQQAAPCDPAFACYDAFISLPNVTGDFYLDGNLVVAGVNSTRIHAAPGAAHTLDVRNMQAPGTPGYGALFIYPDQSFPQPALNGGTLFRVYFYPRQTFIRGTLRYTCLPQGYRPADSVACRPTIDGVLMPDVPPGGRADYTLDPGPHNVHTDLVGDQAQNWSLLLRDDAATVTAGRTAFMTASFPLKGIFKVSLLPVGLVGDIYLDGNLIVAQSAGVDMFTSPQVAHTLEVRNVVDPSAAGRWRYENASLQATTFAGGTRWVSLRPLKVWLQGTLSFFCQINRKTAADDAACEVKLNGGSLGVVPAGARQTWNVAVGTHTLQAAVVGASATRWDGPVTSPVTIPGGGYAYYTGRFNLLPTAVVGAPVPPPVGGVSGAFELGGQVAGFDRPDLMRYAGMVWVKRQVRWSPGAAADAGLIADAHGKGFKILLSVLGHPGDIAGGANYADYARFVGELAGHGADAIEVWNEMNIDREWPAGEINPASYTELLRQAYLQIKAKNPGTLVISGAPAPTGAEGAFGKAHVWNDNTFIAGMAAAGAANYMDCVGVHYNEGIISPTQASGDPRDNYYTRYYPGMVSTYFNAFGGARKLCFTELGYLTSEGYGFLSPSFGWAGGTSLAEHAQWLAEAVSLARSSSTVRMIVVFNMDLTRYDDDPQAGYAMLRPGGSCPACDTLHNVTGGR